MFGRMSFTGLCGVLVALAVGGEYASAATGYSYSPRKHLLKIWEPCLWDRSIITTGPGDMIVAAIDQAGKFSQGYVVDRYQDKDKDDSYAECERDAWDAFATDTGIGFVNSHGCKRLVVGVAVGTTKSQKSLANAWRFRAGSDHRAIKVDWWEDKGIYTCDVKNHWFRRNWRDTFNTNRSIVVVQSCDSAAGFKSVVKSCGGRIGFGYPDGVANSDGVHNNKFLFGRMNGTLLDAKKRRAGDAYAAGDFYRGFRRIGNDDTTLCPSVMNDEEGKVRVRPVGSGAGRAGTGWVIFDTFCDTSVPAEEALTYKIKKGKKVTISNIRWGANELVIFFDYKTDCITHYIVEMTAHGDKVRAEGGGELYLDGGTPEEEGVAPNGDPFIWTFEETFGKPDP